MRVEHIISQFSDHQGMKLVDFAEVALPVYRITSNILVHQKVELDTIEEFILRSVNLGFNHVEKINELLGLSTEVSKEGLTQLIRADLLIEKLNGTVELTPQGIESVNHHSKVRPEEQQVIFDYDGLIRKVRMSKENIYLAPKEIKASGLIEIRSIPARRPEENEIEIQQVRDYIGSSDTEKTLLRIRGITRAVRLFYKAIILIYKPQGRDNYEAAFCIENQLSGNHALAFINQDGLKRLNLLKEKNNDLSPEKIVKEFANFSSLNEEPPTNKIRIGYKNPRKNDNKINKNKTLYPRVHEYPGYLSDCLNNTDNFLLITSPFLSSKVIDHDFYLKILNLVRSGVFVHIGYSDDSAIIDDTSWKSLIGLTNTNKNITIIKNLNIKANILIKDSNYYIISDFDFLSYKGSIKKKFSNVWGNYVSDNDKISKFSNEVLTKYFSKETG